jgi:predicted O-linked N-acetylglucosamine transferase (SPINDLY family)
VALCPDGEEQEARLKEACLKEGLTVERVRVAPVVAREKEEKEEREEQEGEGAAQGGPPLPT